MKATIIALLTTEGWKRFFWPLPLRWNRTTGSYDASWQKGHLSTSLVSLSSFSALLMLGTPHSLKVLNTVNCCGAVMTSMKSLMNLK